MKLKIIVLGKEVLGVKNLSHSFLTSRDAF